MKKQITIQLNEGTIELINNLFNRLKETDSGLKKQVLIDKLIILGIKKHG